MLKFTVAGHTVCAGRLNHRQTEMEKASKTERERESGAK